MVHHLKLFFFEIEKQISLKFGIQNWVHKHYQICSNEDPRLTCVLFIQRSALVPYTFVWENPYILDYSETFEVYNMKVRINIEYTKILVYQR